MKISVIICTRNRGSLIDDTLMSIVAGKRRPDEIWVIDQSDDQRTEEAVAETANKSLFPIDYYRSQTRGLSRARNEGIAHAGGDLFAFTDDDVIVAADWLHCIESEFEKHPNLSLVFGTVNPPETYDWKTEAVPYTKLPTTRPVRFFMPNSMSGMGANMVLHKTTPQIVGGFNEELGPGAKAFGDDIEYALRVLSSPKQGLTVHFLDEAQVVHHAGARTGRDYHQFIRSTNGIGLGLCWAYLLRQGKGVYFAKFAQENLKFFYECLKSLFAGRRPRGLITQLYLWRGFLHGLFARPSAS